LLKRLSDPKYAESYLNAALEENDDATFQLALRDVAAAQQVMLPDRHLQLSDVAALLKLLGMQLMVGAKRAA
jgi:hypothetical protein